MVGSCGDIDMMLIVKVELVWNKSEGNFDWRKAIVSQGEKEAQLLLR